MKVVGIISLFNPENAFCKNIKKTYEIVDELIIIDDSDFSHRYLLESILQEKNIYYEWNGCNIGLTKSINKGIKKAIERKANWILMMDQDSFPENDIASIYMEYIKHNCTTQTAMLIPQYDYDRHPVNSIDKVKEVHRGILSGAFINVLLLAKIGPFDERFFTDGLDIEWSLRAKKKGFSLVECSKAVIHHTPAKTQYLTLFGKKIIGYGYSPLDRHYYQIKSGFLIFHEYHNVYILKSTIIKMLKSFFIYGDSKKYIKANIDAFTDFKAGYYGKYDG